MSEKTCSKCKTTQLFTSFSRCKKSADCHTSWCKLCNSERVKKAYHKDVEVSRARDRTKHAKNRENKNAKSRTYYHANKDKYRNYHLKKCYGIKQVDYEMMLRYQQNKCAICNDELNNKLLVDHNHKTEEIRGLLCNSCNALIGYAKENPDILNSAIDYLTDYPAQFLPIKKVEPCLT